MPKWEYEMLSGPRRFHLTTIESALNDYGEDGWEVVGIIAHDDMLTVFLKRQKAEQEGE
jgi:hypothetical protein